MKKSGSKQLPLATVPILGQAPSHHLLVPDWPAPANIRAVITTRLGGTSKSPYDSFNLATHVGDRPEHVAANRQRLAKELGLKSEPCWLQQIHSSRVVEVHETQHVIDADAGFSRQPQVVCVVMTADCLPVLFCDRQGSVVAAAHAGWRGLVGGILEATISAMQVDGAELMAWLGPAIGARVYEVGVEVRDAFVSQMPEAASAFVATGEAHWSMDIYQLARQRLQASGLEHIYGGELCTFSDSKHFYSYRRDGVTGRMASLIWRQD